MAAGRLEVTIDGTQFLAALKRIGQDLSGPAAGDALMAGALPIVNEIKRRAPVKTGDYRRSIHAEKTGPAEVTLGTDKPQGARLEFGFNGADKRGRRYHQAARPHFRPALDTKAAEAEAAIGTALDAIIAKAGA